MRTGPELRAPITRSIIEATVRAVVPGHRLPEIVGPIRVGRLIGLLRLITGPREVMIEQPWREFVADNRLDCGHTAVQLAAVMVRRPIDRLSGYSG